MTDPKLPADAVTDTPDPAAATPAQATSSEEGLVAARRAKAAALREQGGNPFPSVEPNPDRQFIGDLRRAYASALVDVTEQRYSPEAFEALPRPGNVVVYGRVVSRRGFGKLTFLRVRDGSGEIQLLARRDGLGSDFEHLSALDVGDHVQAAGAVILTKTGELSLDLQLLKPLGKALRPLPEKWHGLTDVEQRYRRRYVDLVANPQAAQVLRARSIITQGVRDFLDRRRFLEVETPTLHSLVGGAAARPFITRHNALDLELFLRIAPELYLKRLLVGGLERVYEIGRCYRNEGLSTRHNPEFTMLEAYQAYATYNTLIDLNEQLLRHVDRWLHSKLSEQGFEQQADVFRSARRFTLEEPFVRLPMRTAITAGAERAALGEPLLDWVQDPSFDAAVFGQRCQEWRGRSARAGAIDWHNLARGLAKAESPGERVFVTYEYVAEPFLPEDYRSHHEQRSLPVFVLDHPTDVSPLARRRDDQPDITERFELFVDAMELGNAFTELNDPDDQAARFQAQVEKKGRGQDETMDYDADYIRALEHGMPPAAGFGVGIDRLTMKLTGQESIRDVLAFPLLRPEART
jgi:lysyl-tRNA synthetase, class II